jgi:alkylhydroperoxidase family enzyme
MALVTPLEKGTSTEVDALAAFFDETLGFTPNSVFIALNMAVMVNEGRVTSEQKRLIGYLASLSSGCRYCQAHTALAAKRYGASDDRLHAIWQYRDSPLFTAAERAAFDFAVAASSVPNSVDDAIADALHAHWTDEDIVEILGVISLFGFPIASSGLACNSIQHKIADA